MGSSTCVARAALVLFLIALTTGQLGAAADSSPAAAATTAMASTATFVEATIRLAGPPVGTFDSSQQPMLIRRAQICTCPANPSAVCSVTARRRHVRAC